MYTYIYTHVYAYIYTHTHAHIYIHIYIYAMRTHMMHCIATHLLNIHTYIHCPCGPELAPGPALAHRVSRRGAQGQ